MQNGDETLPSIISAAQSLLEKILITLEWHSIFDQISHTYIFQHCLDTGDKNYASISQASRGQLVEMLISGMQNGDEALLNISLAGHGQLVEMFITLEPHEIF